ncbi:MAG: response regulator, partial [Actinobacteria bacterium]|nr:response regulator [Actinomycetota bacterium]
MSGHERRAVVIEDDPDVGALIGQTLAQSGFDIHEAATADDGMSLVRSVAPDLITLDLGLPDLDGIELCRRIRAITDAYIVMLTGRPDEIDRLMGLEIGADDYLTKPF